MTPQTGEEVARFFMDLFPREGKFSHAAAFPLVSGRRLEDGTYQKPLSAIVANFTKPGSERPSLLQHKKWRPSSTSSVTSFTRHLTKAEMTRFAGSSTEGRLRRGPQPDHGELDLGTRDPGPFRPPLPDE